MNYFSVRNFLGSLLLFLSLYLLLPLGVAIGYGEHDARAFAVSAALTAAAGFALRRPGVAAELSHRDAFAIVTLGWLTVALFGALPFVLSGTFTNYADALFEAMSGVTTTGASVLTDLESQPHGLLLWRSLLQWLGGMGFIVLSIAILPKLGVGGMELFKAEVPSPIPERLKPRIQETALTLWKIYVGLTVAMVALLYLTGLTLFDATVHTLSTVSSGGFSNRADSLGAFNNGWAEAVVIVFMIASGVNFSLHYRALFDRSPGDVWKNTEFRAYLAVLAVGIVAVAGNLWLTGTAPLLNALRQSAFQVVSIVTTTGFSTTDYNLWPPFATLLLFVLMFSGAMAGSTSGSIKVMRHLLIAKHGLREILRLIHPRAVRPVRVGTTPISERVISSVLGFAVIFIVLCAGGTLYLTTEGLDLISAASASAATLTNVGPGLGAVGPAGHFADLSTTAKLVLTAFMLVGRLEVYAVLVLFAPSVWAKARHPQR